jgi:hypothetical protein
LNDTQSPLLQPSFDEQGDPTGTFSWVTVQFE